MRNILMKSIKETGSAVNLIGKGTSIEGIIHSDSSIIVHGKLKGEINCKGTITVGANGEIEGKIQAQNMIVGGHISGTIKIADKLVLENKASLKGELKTSKLVIDEGAVFDGKSHMGESSSKTIKLPLDEKLDEKQGEIV